MSLNIKVPPRVCPRCQRENLPLAQTCSCGQALGGGSVVPAQGIRAGFGRSPVSNAQPGSGPAPGAGGPREAPSGGGAGRRHPRRLVLAAAALGLGALVAATTLLGHLGSAQADPAYSPLPGSSAEVQTVPGGSIAPGPGSSPSSGGSASPAPVASVQAPISISAARLDAGRWTITQTVTSSTSDAVQAGDRISLFYDATYACGAPPCDLRIAARDPLSPDRAMAATFSYVAGTYTAQEPLDTARCILGDGSAVSGAYQVHVTSTLHATAAKQQNGHLVATQLAGVELREGKPTPSAADQGCKPWDVWLATRGEPGDPAPDQITRSVNWSGYSVGRHGAQFTNVEGTWVQPAVSCQSVRRQMASFWVGIDGVGSHNLQQIGTSSECHARRQDLYYAWWEMLPAPMVRIQMLIRPGDTIHAKVSWSGSHFTLSITNVTLDATFSIGRSNPLAKRATAEWVAEATSMCGARACQVSALPDFNQVRFTGCKATAGGETALLGDGLWTRSLDLMVESGHRTVLKALPSAIDAGSDGFTVEWRSVGP